MCESCNLSTKLCNTFNIEYLYLCFDVKIHSQSKNIIMKSKLLVSLSLIFLICMPVISFGQAPVLGSTAGFALFTADGAFSNVGNATIVTGNVGNHVGQFTAFAPGTLVGQKHVADPVSTLAATDVATAYSDLFSLTCGEVLDTLLGTNQVLIPKVYCIGKASTLKGDLILDGQGDPNAIFVFKIDGALSTATFSNVVLTNSTQLKNVYWQIGGAFSLGDSSVFRGTIIADGAINLLEGSSLLGRGLSKAGAISLHNNIVTIVNAGSTGVASIQAANIATIAPNPFSSYATVTLNNGQAGKNCKISIYSTLGTEVISTTITSGMTTINTSHLQSGIYFYKVMESDKIVQTGKLISQQ